MAKKLMHRITCTKCKKRKKPLEFHKNSRRANGLNNWCKLCVNADSSRRYWALTPEERKDRNRRHAANTVEQRRANVLRRKFKMTVEEFDARVEGQDGRCAACNDRFTKTPHVDHDHDCCPEKGQSCGQCIRGLLCVYCNTALGYTFDDVERLEALATYLKKWK